MALVTTVIEVVGVLAAMAMLLWFSAVLEARQLGPVVHSATGGVAPEPEPALAAAAVGPEPRVAAA